MTPPPPAVTAPAIYDSPPPSPPPEQTTTPLLPTCGVSEPVLTAQEQQDVLAVKRVFEFERIAHAISQRRMVKYLGRFVAAAQQRPWIATIIANDEVCNCTYTL